MPRGDDIVQSSSKGERVCDPDETPLVSNAQKETTKGIFHEWQVQELAAAVDTNSASELDIFIGGRRLLLTSEDGSTVNYTVDGSTASVTLTSVPASGTQVKNLEMHFKRIIH